MPDRGQCGSTVAMLKEAGLRWQVAEISAAWDDPDPGLNGHRLKAPQHHTKALILGITRSFPDVDPVNEQSIADVGGILFAVETSIAHQHMKAVYASGQKGDGAPRTGGDAAAAPENRFDLWGGGMHSSPTRPPRVHGPQTLDQHRAGVAFDPHSSFAVNRGEGEASGEKCIGTGPVATFRDLVLCPRVESIVLNFKRQHLIGKVPILPYDSCGGASHAAARRQG
ncbi:MAG TPA: hypothetical protein VEH02_09515 [Pseudolabrys sp.]|nr:hypothetical protein [Pseudolabrys sp.]